MLISRVLAMSLIKRKLSEPYDVKKNLFDLKTDGTLCDVQLQLQGSTISAHACVLASCSSYFLELFQLNQAIHWCARNPLVIDLDRLLDKSTDFCAICVSKIIDFMYLRELVILQGHYEHFVLINHLFHVFDSVPLEKNSKPPNLGKDIKVKSSNKEQLVDKLTAEKLNEKVSGESLSKQVSTIHKLSTDQQYLAGTEKTTENNLGRTSSLDEGTSNQIKPKPENSTVCRMSPTIFKRSDVLNTENSLKKTCEFMCCNPEPEINSNSSRLRKRRKMSCKLCDFSSVSIKKVLQHLHSTEHFQSTCPVCLREMSNVDGLKDHLKDHVDSKPFICQMCNKRNRYWEYHKMHLKIHCRNKSFYCDLCQRGFLSKRSLTEHLTTHKGSYLCKDCDYYTSDIDMYRSHLLSHKKDALHSDHSDSGLKFNFGNDIQLTKLRVKSFKCQVCGEGFTQKKNLARHVKLKHFDATKFNCSVCEFVSDRIDILSIHMKKKHNCILVKEKKKSLARKVLKKNHQNSSEYVNVLIPMQIFADNSSVNAFVPEDTENVFANTKDIPDRYSNSHEIHQNSNVELVYVESEVTIDSSAELETANDSFTFPSDNLQDQRSNLEPTKLKDFNETEESEILNSGINTNSLQANFMSVSMEIKPTENSSQTLNSLDLNHLTESNTIVKEGNQYIWLNETTGELLNDESVLNIQQHKTIAKVNQNFSGAENSTLDFSSTASAECSALDFIDESEEWQLPQTPQTSFGIDDCENLFPWNQIDNSFYSTWVLNETTGELNMVSFFSIQSVKNPTELKLGEESKSPASPEDDDTALFLNEGTGDLSVIYFKPNGMERDEWNVCHQEKQSHDNLETRSDVSDDDSDWLNEEFFRVSANFMSNEENEKFLNELTGEFDIANLDNYQTELLTNQVAGNESYLNEETGEISWNIMDGSENNDLLTKTDGLEYDLDDSLNCEDFEPFFRDVSEFSSQFGLNEDSKPWNKADETSDVLVLNECTGELIKKS